MQQAYSDPVGHHTLNVIAKAGHFNQWMYQTIKPYLKGNILEIGSGIGNISKFVISDGFQITLSDYDAGYCQYLKQQFGNRPNVQQILSIDLQDAAFYSKYQSLNGIFDTVYLLNVVEHLADDKKALTFCHYLLKKGGNLIILVPAFQQLYCGLDKNLGHFKRYAVPQLKELLHNDFTIIQYRYANALGFAGWLFWGKVLRLPVLQKGEMQVYDKLVPLARLADWFLHRLFGLSIIFIAQKK